VPGNLAVTVGADELTLDALAGRWRIYQLRNGHRFSADDLLTAWTAPAPAIRP
jgi:tRNA1(Val) A37 N6-methylase TrmN6